MYFYGEQFDQTSILGQLMETLNDIISSSEVSDLGEDFLAGGKDIVKDFKRLVNRKLASEDSKFALSEIETQLANAYCGKKFKTVSIHLQTCPALLSLGIADSSLDISLQQEDGHLFVELKGKGKEVLKVFSKVSADKDCKYNTYSFSNPDRDAKIEISAKLQIDKYFQRNDTDFAVKAVKADKTTAGDGETILAKGTAHTEHGNSPIYL